MFTTTSWEIWYTVKGENTLSQLYHVFYNEELFNEHCDKFKQGLLESPHVDKVWVVKVETTRTEISRESNNDS